MENLESIDAVSERKKKAYRYRYNLFYIFIYTYGRRCWSSAHYSFTPPSFFFKIERRKKKRKRKTSPICLNSGSINGSMK